MAAAEPCHQLKCGCAEHLSRRRFMAGAAALGAAAALPGSARGEAAHLIDTHHHFYAPAYQKAWLDFGEARKIAPFPSQVAWTREKAVEEMDKNDVRTGILSLPSTPGLWFNDGPEAAARMARTCDDFDARHRRHAQGNRIRVRHAQGGWRRAADELRRQVVGRRGVSADFRRAQPAPAGGLRASVGRRRPRGL